MIHWWYGTLQKRAILPWDHRSDDIRKVTNFFQFEQVFCGKLYTWNPKIEVWWGWKMMFLFNWVIFRFQSLTFRGCVCPFFQLPARFFHFQKVPRYAPCVGKHRLYSHRIHGTGTGIFTKPFPLVHVATFHLGKYTVRPMDFYEIFRSELAGNLSGRRFFQSPRLLQTFAFNFCGKSSESPGFWPTNIPKICVSKISSTCWKWMIWYQNKSHPSYS